MGNKIRIVFFGTPEFAKCSLATLFESGFDIAAVVTAPDKPAGRGQKLKFSEVKEYALEKDIPLLQPANLKDEQFVELIRKIAADLHIVVAFRMLPEVVWSMPPLGTINLHGSLLPQYRGAAPINHAIINGERMTGVTTFRLKHEIDTGDIILKREIEIDDNESAGELHDRMMTIGAEILKESVLMIQDGTVTFKTQNDIDTNTLKRAPKIFKKDCCIDFYNSGEEIINLIRGLSPYPTAYFTIIMDDSSELDIKVFKARFIPEKEPQEPLKISTDNNTFFAISVKNGKILIEELQISGKKRLKIADFIRGFNMNRIISVKY